jgi:NAD(P)-dependent dehydrogenase (short-subunit alcohol dehydrogenase family)
MGALDGKRAMVTGATSGIGRAVALAFAAEGAFVVACGRDADALASLQQELGERGIAQRCDVTSEADIEAIVVLAVEKYGGLDVAFNCAGMAGMSRIRAGDLDLADQIWQTNVRDHQRLVRQWCTSGAWTCRLLCVQSRRRHADKDRSD